MTDRPIIFSAPMVRALLEDQKTQTRRLFWTRKDLPPPHTIAPDLGFYICRWPSGMRHDVNPRHQLGDRLWVRENVRFEQVFDDHKPTDLPNGEIVARHYEADGARAFWKYDHLPQGKIRPSIHMPRWASRITLEVIDTRIERLKDISEVDAIAEGCRPFFDAANPVQVPCPNGDTMEMEPLKGPREAFENLWDSLNADRASWNNNPWVSAYTFKVIKQNVDRLTA